ncbi:MAG: hypothetical protein OEW19_17465 [Acidobacteriota bacterium]|nr:hypothetical protein [Acidobacteriota bacterium]
MTETTRLVDSLTRTWGQVMGALPDIGLALVLLFAGWLLAKLARRLAIRVFRVIRLDEAAERAGLEDFLIQGGIKFTTVTLLGNAVYWFILLGIFIALLDALGVPAAGGLLFRLANYLPNLLLALGILVFGSLLARVVGAVVYTYLNNIGSAAAEPIAALARLAVLAFVLFTAAEQLAIESRVLVSAFQIAFGALCFALAIAFGLGGRDWAASVIDRYTRK